MAEKLECPGCDSYTSSILDAVGRNEPCPHCGLSAGAIIEVTALRRVRQDDELTGRLTEALMRADRAEERAERAERTLDELRRLVNAMDDDGG